MKNKQIIIVVIMLFISLSGFSQVFVNGELEGTAGYSAAPPGWTKIYFWDLTCIAYDGGMGTVDVCGVTWPYAGGSGYNYIAHSGNTYSSGLMGLSVSASAPAGRMFHEGIKQTVSGFTPGDSYTLSFYQSVARPLSSNTYQHLTGSWDVYAGYSLIGTSASSTCTIPYGDINAVWENRTITFTAPTASITFKFYPKDPIPSDFKKVRMNIDDISIISPLPVELVDFKGICNEENIEYTWSTASEMNTDYFIVETSTNGVDWTAVGEILGAGNSASLLNYELEDRNPEDGYNYSRLIQVDLDGSRVVSKIIVVDNCKENKLSIFPNPANLFVTITSDAIIKSIDLFDIHGNLIVTREVPNEKAYILDIVEFSNGMYFLRINTTNGIQVKRFGISK